MNLWKQSGFGVGFSPYSSGFSVNIIPPWLYILIYNLGDEKQAHWWLQLKYIF
jgi:hypothetical protein